MLHDCVRLMNSRVQQIIMQQVGDGRSVEGRRGLEDFGNEFEVIAAGASCGEARCGESGEQGWWHAA